MCGGMGCVGLLQVGGEWWTVGAEEALGRPWAPEENQWEYGGVP